MQSVDQATKLFKFHSQIRGTVCKQLTFLVWLQIIKHSFAHLEALLFLFVKVLYNFHYCLALHKN